jgi:hypothetical protein
MEPKNKLGNICKLIKYKIPDLKTYFEIKKSKWMSVWLNTVQICNWSSKNEWREGMKHSYV